MSGRCHKLGKSCFPTNTVWQILHARKTLTFDSIAWIGLSSGDCGIREQSCLYKVMKRLLEIRFSDWKDHTDSWLIWQVIWEFFRADVEIKRNHLFQMWLVSWQFSGKSQIFSYCALFTTDLKDALVRSMNSEYV